MKLLCTLFCAVGAIGSQLPFGSRTVLQDSATEQAVSTNRSATAISERVARQAALDIGWDLAHALGHSSSVPNAGRNIPEMG